MLVPLLGDRCLSVLLVGETNEQKNSVKFNVYSKSTVFSIVLDTRGACSS